jgi:hypothetical protein
MSFHVFWPIEVNSMLPRRSFTIAVAASTFLAQTLALLLILAPSIPAQSAPASLSKVLADLPGRWTGDGRLGFKDGKMETVSCRATYFAADDVPGLKQTIRCASPSGKIELKSRLEESDGVLKGEWSEEMYNLKGELTGKVNERGLVVSVKGSDLDANMDVIVKGNRQIVEIQFHNTSLIGLTLILTRSTAGGES